MEAREEGEWARAWEGVRGRVWASLRELGMRSSAAGGADAGLWPGAWREDARGARKGLGVARRPASPAEGSPRALEGLGEVEEGEAVSEPGAAGRRERRAPRHSPGTRQEEQARQARGREGGVAARCARAVEPPWPWPLPAARMQRTPTPP